MPSPPQGERMAMACTRREANSLREPFPSKPGGAHMPDTSQELISTLAGPDKMLWGLRLSSESWLAGEKRLAHS